MPRPARLGALRFASDNRPSRNVISLPIETFRNGSIGAREEPNVHRRDSLPTNWWLDLARIQESGAASESLILLTRRLAAAIGRAGRARSVHGTENRSTCNRKPARPRCATNATKL